MSSTQKNWAGNITFAATAVHTPASVEEVQAIVARAGKVRAAGARHSFNAIADTDADQISLRHLNKVLDINAAARTVTVEGGITYGQLGPELHAAGFALHNLASLPHITVAGACSTATHGSGVGNKNLATSVAGLEIVTADGELVSLLRGDADFAGAVVALGALGIVTKLTLEVQPTFEVRQRTYLDLPFAVLAHDFEAVMSAAYSVSLFTDWQGDHINQVWLKLLAEDASDPGESFHGAHPADRAVHPIPEVDPTPVTAQLGVPGPWYDRLPHFRTDFTPSAGDELQTEYFVARADAPAALSAIKDIQDQIAPHLLISEIRTIAADTLWMSHNYQQDSVGIHFTWKPDWAAVRQVLPVIEAQLAPFKPRPHWGKLFTMNAADVQARYQRLGDFRALLARHDPNGKFRNAFVDDYVF